MNYFSKNRLITIFVVALMVINITALITIAANSRFFRSPKRPAPIENISERNQDSHRKKEKRFFEIMSENLELSEEQQASMAELWKSNKEKMKEVMTQMDETRKQLNEEMGSKQLNLPKIEQLNDSVASMDKRIRENLLEYNMKVREMLNEEQLEKYLDMLSNMRERKGRQRRGPTMDMIQIF